ncbi:MAG: hypothetical protein HYX41_06455 [Bdellovibrio sp.]|nr:hypothetical protein [Bdellovibrio sp.]
MNQKQLKYRKRKVFLALVLCLLLGFAFRKLYLTSQVWSSDLEVFWRAATAFWNGRDPYLPLGEEKGFVFKYHPTLLVFFLPLTLMTLSVCKAVWLGVEVLSIAYCFKWLKRSGISIPTLVLVTGLFWFLWFEHIKYGQIMAPLLAFTLYAGTPTKQRAAWKVSFMIYLLSSKVFTLFALLGNLRKLLTREILLGLVAVTFGLHLVVSIIFAKNGIHLGTGFHTLYQSWIDNAFHNARDLGLGNVRGAVNHGFTALVLRNLDPQGVHPEWDAPVAIALLTVLGALWWRVSRQFRFERKWSGWLALSAVCHPLAWSHSFVFVYPMACYSVHCAFHSFPRERYAKRAVLTLISLLGIAMMGLWVPQTVGLDRAITLELLGLKAWGAFLCAVALALA